MILILVASVMMANAADTKKYHRFYNGGFYDSNPSPEQAKTALKALFSGNDAQASQYWNTSVAFSEMRDIFALHIQETFKMAKAPSDEDMYRMVDISDVVAAPANFATGFETSGIAKGTTKQVYFQREITPGGELLLAVQGIVWTSIRCGNPSRQIMTTAVPAVQEEFDTPIQKKSPYQFASCEGCPPRGGTDRNGDVTVTVTPTLMNTFPAAPQANNGGGGNNDALLMMMLMQNMNNRQPAERPQSTFLPTLLGSLLGSGVGTFAGNALSNRNQRGYSQRGYQSMPTYRPQVWDEQYPQQQEGYRYPQEQPGYRQPQYRQPQYREPSRVYPDYNRRPPYGQESGRDFQGGSNAPGRDYSRYATGENSNAYGLGVGQPLGYSGGYTQNGTYGGNTYQDRNDYYDTVSPLQDDGRGNAVNTRTGRGYTYGRSW